MTDPLAVLRRALQTYLVLMATLGLVTFGWAAATMVSIGGVTLASAWFALAGAGTMLVAVLILQRRFSSEPVGPSDQPPGTG